MSVATLLSPNPLSLYCSTITPGGVGGNTTFGASSLPAANTGTNNTAFGVSALGSNTTGSDNTALGQNALMVNTTGGNNTAVGQNTMKASTSSTSCTAVGENALLAVVNMSQCLALGANCMQAFVGAGDGSAALNVGVGNICLESLTTGESNTAVGENCLSHLIGGGSNTCVGVETGGNLITAGSCTAIGAQAMGGVPGSDSGNSNTAVGATCMQFIQGGAAVLNTAVGFGALVNTAIAPLTGGQNTVIGASAGASITTGNSNTIVGQAAGAVLVSGSNSVILGQDSGGNITTASNVICINSVGGNDADTCWIGGIDGATAPAGSAVLIGANGQLGTIMSSIRYKENIRDMSCSSKIYSLRPVEFDYKAEVRGNSTGAPIPSLGLIAEEVDKVMPEIVVRRRGEIETVQYHQLIPMLLNEAIKHKHELTFVNDKAANLADRCDKLETQNRFLNEAIESLKVDYSQLKTIFTSYCQRDASRQVPATPVSNPFA
jgi:hypothetical protein